MTGVLSNEEIRGRLSAAPGWSFLAEESKLARQWRFPDFATALAFLNRAAAICEEQNHHADFELAWGRVDATLWSHDVGGITERDFRLVAALGGIDRASS